MLTLDEHCTLYHGSYAPIEHIDLRQCAPGKDFGRGFYLTSSYDQAKEFIRLSVRKRQATQGGVVGNEGFVSKYHFSPDDSLRVHVFEEADASWLHFIAANRRGDLFPGLVEKYSLFDVVIGKIANDRTARTLQLYVAEAFGKPGSAEADSIAIATLLPDRLENQLCFRSSRAIACLVYGGSDRHGLPR